MINGNTSSLLIDWICPVNWSHPLNRGLAGWWMGVPGATGGPIMHDLTRRNHGVLTNMDPGTDWVASPYGPVLDFLAASSNYVAGTGVLPGGNLTIEGSCYVSTAGGKLFSLGSTGSTGEWLFINHSGFDAIDFNVENTAYSFYPVASTFLIDSWIWWCCTLNGTTGRMYVGAPGIPGVGFRDSGDQTLEAFTGNGNWNIGRWVLAGGATFTGKVQFTKVYSGAKSPAEAYQLFSQWQVGFPDLLNRRRTYVRGAAAGGNIPPFNNRRYNIWKTRAA